MQNESFPFLAIAKTPDFVKLKSYKKKYKNADREWIWQFVFPSNRISQNPRSKIIRRHHLHESGLQKALKQEVKATGINKRVSCHTFRHSFATRY